VDRARPQAETLRTAQSLVSAMKMFPEPSTTTVLRNPSVALVAKLPSLEYPQSNNPVVSGGVPATGPPEFHQR
jgi:hypothetical protein